MSWSIAESKARFSELIRKARKHAQIIESRGEEVAVVMSLAEYRRLQAAASGATTPMERFLSRAQLWRARTGGVEFEIPERSRGPERPPVRFDEV